MRSIIIFLAFIALSTALLSTKDQDTRDVEKLILEIQISIQNHADIERFFHRFFTFLGCKKIYFLSKCLEFAKKHSAQVIDVKKNDKGRIEVYIIVEVQGKSRVILLTAEKLNGQFVLFDGRSTDCQ